MFDVFEIKAAVVASDIKVRDGGEKHGGIVFEFGQKNEEYKFGAVDEEGIGYASKDGKEWVFAFDFTLKNGNDASPKDLFEALKEAKK